jgi:hypothetical protein
VSKNSQISDQIAFLVVAKAGFEKVVIAVHYGLQGCESTIVVEATFLMP